MEPQFEASDAAQREPQQPLLSASGAGLPLQVGATRRDFAALLEVTRDDALRLAAGRVSEARRRGLRSRLRSALGVLPLAARSYLQDDARAESAAVGGLAAATRALRAEDWSQVATALSAMCAAYPLSLTGLRAEDATAAAAAAAGRSFRASCGLCHRSSQPDAALPAPDLRRWARSMPAREFVARMIDGVHGTAFTGFENPLSDAEIAAFYAYLERPAATGRRAAAPDGQVPDLLRHSPGARR